MVGEKPLGERINIRKSPNFVIVFNWNLVPPRLIPGSVRLAIERRLTISFYNNGGACMRHHVVTAWWHVPALRCSQERAEKASDQKLHMKFGQSKLVTQQASLESSKDQEHAQKRLLISAKKQSITQFMCVGSRSVWQSTVNILCVCSLNYKI